MEEPALVTSLDETEVKLVQEIYIQLAATVPEANIMLQTYFESLSAYKMLIELPVKGIGLDFVHGYTHNMEALRQFGFPQDKVLAAGVINGRDIWRANLAEVSTTVRAIEQLTSAEELWIQSSCSLQHVPISTALETKLEPVLKNALAFADEKLVELTEVAKYLNEKNHATNYTISESMKAIEALKNILFEIIRLFTGQYKQCQHRILNGKVILKRVNEFSNRHFNYRYSQRLQ